MGCEVTVVADEGQSLGAVTRDMMQRLQKLHYDGVVVRLAKGKPCQPVYAEIGRSVKPCAGKQHSKVLRVGPYLLVGSANWSQATKANCERGVLVRLTAAGIRAQEQEFQALIGESQAPTPELEAEGFRRREKNR